MHIAGSSSRLRRRVLLIAAVAILVSLAGCSGLLESDPELPSGAEAAEQFSSVDVYNATLVFETRMDNETTTSRIERTVRPATGERYEEVIRNGNRTITVSNGTTTWTYSPADDEVTVVSVDDSNGGTNQSEQIKQLFESIETDETDGILVTPLLPPFSGSWSQGSDGSSGTETGFWTDPVEVSYEGVETVSDRETHVVTMESAEDAERRMEQTLYVDTEYYVVLRGEWEMEIETGEQVRQVSGSMRVEDVEFDPAVDDDIFEFEPPDNATVSRVGQNISRFESYDALVTESDKPVPSPEVPSDYEFRSGTITTDAVSVVYTNGTADIFVTRRTTGDVRGEAEEIRRNGRTYYYDDQFGSSTVQWRCGDVIYSAGGQIDQETLLTIADSVQCPPSSNA